MSTAPALLEALEYCVAHRLTFAAFRTPSGQVTLWAQQTPELDRVDNGLWWELNDVFLFAPFDIQERIPIIRSDVELTFGDAEPAWHRLMECTGAASDPASSPRPAMAKQEFETAVRKAQEHCRTGKLEKAVLSRSIDLDVSKQDAPRLFVEALDQRPEALVTLVATPEHGVWLGASPERLILAENDIVHIDAMAGTLRSAEAPTQAQDWGEKERHEQNVVTRTITGTLIDLGIPSISLEGPEVMITGSIAHLRTRITATAGGRSVGDVVLALHPTPAVCGVPLDLARTVILESESRDRELYAGFWGPWSADGRMELFVNIRCMRLFDTGAQLHVGAGITAGSIAASEWDETEHKADSWRSVIQALATTRVS
ncbi:MAG: chorismate-binding protein [Flavobacteriales bacterium]|nr:chorismate-binding protein [Flavobacteriales bacterium]